MSRVQSGDGWASVAAAFDAVAAGYDRAALRLFPFVADRLVHGIGLARGAKVLDVGVGTGAATLAAAQIVGTPGRVIGIDIAEQMLERAYRSHFVQRLENVDLHEMDGEKLDFRARYFDAVVCASAIYLMKHPAAAVREWCRVTRSGGWVAFSSLAPGAMQPLAGRYLRCLARYGITAAEEALLPWLRLAEPARIHALLEQAGLVDCRVDKHEMGYSLKDAEAWWELLWHTELRRPLQALPADELARLRAEHLEEVGELSGDQGLWLDAPALFAYGRRA